MILVQNVHVVHWEAAVRFVTRHLAIAHVMTTTYRHFAPTPPALYAMPVYPCNIASFLCSLQDGFFLFGSVCTACDCNPVGAVNASCTLPDGQCHCRENITNTRCNAPANGFYARPLDFFIFEAEDATYPNVRPECFNRVCNTVGDVLAIVGNQSDISRNQ